MASFPGSIYSVQNPTPSTSRADGTTGPAEQVAALNGEVEAIETYIGTTGSPNLLPLAGGTSFTPFRWTIEPPTTTETWAIGDPATNTWLQLEGNAFNVGSNLNLNGAASGTTRLTLGNGMLTTDAAITLQSPWTNSIAFDQSGVQHWLLYDGNSNLLIMRDMVNAWNVWVLYPGVGNNSQFALGCVFLPAQAVTTSAPSYVKGAMYFDTTLNKLRIGGVSAWETVTSA